MSDDEIQTYLKSDSGLIAVEVAGRPTDIDYVEGAICWKADGQTLISQNEWDLIDQLWAYIVDGLHTLLRLGVYETYFPDQPLLLSFRLVDAKTVEVQVGDRTALVEPSVFFLSLVQGGEAFFRRMLEIIPEHGSTWNENLSKLDPAKAWIGIAAIKPDHNSGTMA